MCDVLQKDQVGTVQNLRWIVYLQKSICLYYYVVQDMSNMMGDMDDTQPTPDELKVSLDLIPTT